MNRKELLVLIVLLLLNWLYLGSAFGYHSLVGGDDWYMFAMSSLNQLAACTGIPNFHVPYRPLHPTPICVVYQLFGRSSIALTNLSFVAFGLTAFAWYGVSRNLFRLTSAQALLVALLYLSYPDDSGRYTLTGGSRQFG